MNVNNIQVKVNNIQVNVNNIQVNVNNLQTDIETNNTYCYSIVRRAPKIHYMIQLPLLGSGFT